LATIAYACRRTGLMRYIEERIRVFSPERLGVFIGYFSALFIKLSGILRLNIDWNNNAATAMLYGYCPLPELGQQILTPISP